MNVNNITMKFVNLAVVVLSVTLVLGSCGKKMNNGIKTQNKKISEVYVTKNISPQSVINIFEVTGCEIEGRTAIKIFVEDYGNNLIKPDCFTLLVKRVGGVIVEGSFPNDSLCNVFVNYWKSTQDSDGFPAFRCDVLDQNGEMRIPVADTTVIKYNVVGSRLAYYDSMISVSCFDETKDGSFFGTLQNISFGLASRNGKINLVSSINRAKSEAVAAKSVHDYFMGGKRIVYIALLAKNGILSSLDPVALDQACVDIVLGSVQKNKNTSIIKSRCQLNSNVIEWAEKIDLGSKEYTLVNID